MTVEEFIEEWEGKTDYIIAHTSGSTGKPKVIKLPKKMVEDSALRTIKFFNLSEKSLLHLPLSPDYIAGKMMIVRSILSGAKLIYEAPSNHPLSSYSGDRISLTAVVPSQLPSLLRNPSGYLIDKMIIGGAPLSSLLAERVYNSGIESYETYGMTETASHIALRRITSENDGWFTPLPGIKVTLSQEAHLQISIPGSEIITTCDIAELGESGRFRILGRADDAIITGGIKVHPMDVERKAEGIIMGREWYISSQKDEKWGEKVVLVIEGDSESQYIEKIIDEMRLLLSPAELPKDVIFLSTFERTENGKLRRRKF